MSSAIKAVIIRGEGKKVYLTGYDQRLSVWSISRSTCSGFANVANSAETVRLVEEGSGFVSVTDVSDAAVVGLKGGKDLVVVVGDGLDVLKVGGDEGLSRATKAIQEGTHLLVVAGAGMGKDSGLPTFEDLRTEGNYRDMCDPLTLIDGGEREKFYNFWKGMANDYQAASPHKVSSRRDSSSASTLFLNSNNTHRRATPRSTASLLSSSLRMFTLPTSTECSAGWR